MKALNEILNGRNKGLFRNTNGEYCRISKYYTGGNNENFQIIFSKDVFDIATRPAINTTSEKKVLELIKEEGFVLVS